MSVVDCDVHCATPTIEALAPFLPEHWREYLGWTGVDELTAVNVSYPRWAPMFAGGAGATLERIQRDVLGRAELAVLHCFAGLESVHNPYLAAELATAVNRWLQAEWLDRDARLRASAVIAPQDAAAAAAELARVAEDERFVQVLLPARSLEPYGSRRYWPIWHAAAEHGLVLAIVFGGATQTPPTMVNWMSSYYEDYVVATHAIQTQITTLIMSGVFDRWPNLRVVVAESGWTWLPSLLWRMDQEWKAATQEVPWLSEPPSAYLRRHFRFTTQPTDAPAAERQLTQVLQELGSDELLLFGSDYPHVYPAGVELLPPLTPAQRERVLGGNARALYGFGEAR